VVEDGFVHAGLARNAGFLCCGNGATRARPSILAIWIAQAADAARRGVNQAGIAALERISGMREVVEASYPGGMEMAAAVWKSIYRDLDQQRGWNHRIFGVGTPRHGVSHAVRLGRIRRHPPAHGLHRARAFAPSVMGISAL